MFVLSDLPPPAIRLLRGARTLALDLASPFERALSRQARALPPLGLRRHAGPLRHFASSALEAEQLLDRLALLAPDAHVVDLGCGPGAMALRFERRLGPGGRYTGLDVHGPSIRWCRARFAADRRFRFERLERDSPYRTGAGAHQRELPLAAGSADLVLAKSLFTHVLAEEAAELLAEIARVLAPERGRAVVTAFLFDPRRRESEVPRGTHPPWFPHPGADAAVRWHHERWPHAAVAYERGLFEFLARANGLEVERFEAGFFPGDADPPAGQDVLVLSPKGDGDRGRGEEHPGRS